MSRTAIARTYILPILLLLTVVSPAYSEYRVYQYYVKSRLRMIQDDKAYLVTSTLDPVSYQSYHGGVDTIKIDLVRSWKCPGYTGGGKDLCKSPTEALLEKIDDKKGKKVK